GDGRPDLVEGNEVFFNMANVSYHVPPPPLVVQGVNGNAVEGASAELTVATFTDPNGPQPVGDYAATIFWGDGQSSSGNITANSRRRFRGAGGPRLPGGRGLFRRRPHQRPGRPACHGGQPHSSGRHPRRRRITGERDHPVPAHPGRSGERCGSHVRR